MWQGIYVNRGRIKVLNNSIIEDGIEAVVMSQTGNSSQYEITNSTLKNNWYSLITHLQASGSFYGNTVTNDDPLLIPHFGDGSFTGILMHQPNNLSIGHTTNNPNTFSNLKYGIVGVDGNFGVFNNVFDNIHDAMCSGTNMLYDDFSSSCIYAKNTNTTFYNLTVGGATSSLKNIFTNFDNGIIALRMNNDIQKNKFTYGKHTAIRTQWTKNTYLYKNNIRSVKVGISALEVLGDYVVDGNNLSNDYNNSQVTEYGITAANLFPWPFLSWNWSNGWYFPPAYDCNIVNNCIKKYDYGINMETFREPFIDFNYIYRSETAGIRFVNSFDGTIYRNNLVGVNGFSLKGLRITDSENMGIIANQMTYFKEAVHVDGSARNHFLLNALKNSDYGIVINGSIGAQGSSGFPFDNRWYGNFGQMVNNTQTNPHLYTINGSNGNLSPFYTRNQPPYEPSFSSNDGVAGVISIPVYSTSNPFYFTAPALNYCGATPLPNDDDLQMAKQLQEMDTLLLENIALTDTAFFITATDHNNQEMLYYSIKDNTDLLDNNTILKDFVNNKCIENIGILDRVSREIAAENYTLAAQINDSICVPNCCELTAKTVNDLLLAPYLRGEGLMDFTTSELAQLRSIAYGCPFTDGLAVYTARTACRFTDEDWTDYTNLCENQVITSARMAAPTPTKVNELLIYPNPASTNINVQSAIDGVLIITNNIGETVAEHTVAKNEIIEINIAQLTNGMYLCVLMDKNNTVIATEKIDIIR